MSTKPRATAWDVVIRVGSIIRVGLSLAMLSWLPECPSPWVRCVVGVWVAWMNADLIPEKTP